jgi:hypothetical protein
MPDFSAALADAGNNLQDAGISSMDPQAASNDRMQDFQLKNGIPTYIPPVGFQGTQKCFADYNKLPYGWRPSPFMGQCGSKIQLNKFYEGDTPCYPVQDISCMGPREKQAWANMCSTEFPCGPPPTRPGSAGELASPPAPLDLLSSFMTTLRNYWAVVAGLGLVGCFIGGGKGPSKADSDDQSEDVLPEDMGSSN